MHRALVLLVVAIMATFALAAPTPSKTLAKRSFAVPVKGRPKLSPADAMKRAAHKYGFQINFGDTKQVVDDVVGSDGAYSFPSSIEWILPSRSIEWWLPSSSALLPPIASSSAFALSSAVPWASSSGGLASSVPTSFTSGKPNVTKSSLAATPSSTPPPTDGSEEGSVTATPEENDSEYLSPVKIGGQTLNLDFDTGSADLWVYSSQMSSSESSGHSTFDPSKSSTWSTYQGASWEISYGDGSRADGTVGFDTVSVGTAVVQKQCVELAEDVSGSFTQDVNNDGLVGLGFSVINQVRQQPQKTFFENIMADLDQPVFTADLEENAAGTYEFGAIDSSKYTGDIHYTAVDSSSGYWQFESRTYTVGGSQKECTICNPGIADTGTSIILVDQDVADNFYKSVNGATYSSSDGGYTYPCSDSLPDFGVAIGSDYTATVKGADLQYAEVGEGRCFGGVQGTGATRQGQSPQIYGDVLLKQFFAVFDGGNKRFGIAEKA